MARVLDDLADDLRGHVCVESAAQGVPVTGDGDEVDNRLRDVSDEQEYGGNEQGDVDPEEIHQGYHHRERDYNIEQTVNVLASVPLVLAVKADEQGEQE